MKKKDEDVFATYDFFPYQCAQGRNRQRQSPIELDTCSRRLCLLLANSIELHHTYKYLGDSSP